MSQKSIKSMNISELKVLKLSAPVNSVFSDLNFFSSLFFRKLLTFVERIRIKFLLIIQMPLQTVENEELIQKSILSVLGRLDV